MEWSTRPNIDRVWPAVLCAGISPLFVDAVGVAPFVPAYVTVLAGSVAVGFGLRWPTVGDLTYSVVMFALAAFGLIAMLVLLVLGASTWLTFTAGVVVAAICLGSFHSRPDPGHDGGV